ncbi:endonuclease-reverse transcriptase [Elysia marginata]|uniref:Endonuclease-reverse transcriptase n=1 Tax=Elysia marginata TaxID=1093978 RepID=A0AAV4JBL3_9GAST|nr:endonuclease-reverse transcriptase [Elysia marginata]
MRKREGLVVGLATPSCKITNATETVKRETLHYADEAKQARDKHQCIKWTITSMLEDLDYADDLSLIGTKISNRNPRTSARQQAKKGLRACKKNPNIITHTKTRIFRTNVLSILLYGAESWKMTKSLEQRLEVCQIKCLRRFLKIFWPNIISNEDLRGRTGLEPLSTIIRERRLRWLRHVCRRPQKSLIRRSQRWTTQGHIRRRRPKETWRRTVERDLKERGLSFETAPLTEADRPRWRALQLPQALDGLERIE